MYNNASIIHIRRTKNFESYKCLKTNQGTVYTSFSNNQLYGNELKDV